MIRIDRGPVPPSIRVFTAKSVKVRGADAVTRAERERALAIEFFEDIHNYANEAKLTKKTFSFRVYKDVELSTELERIFGNKCAYCESVFAHVTPKDVEHFRPKSEITTDKTSLKPGYYWLAGDWDNLLVSCPDCNRRRLFELPGQPKKVRLGKGTQFPLAQESRRIRAPRRTLGREESQRLLINPCLEDPAEHLTYDDQGLVHARPDAEGNPSKKGEASISAYALQRAELVEARLNVLNQFVLQVQVLRDAIENYNDFLLSGNAAGAERNRLQIVAVAAEIRRMLGPRAPYTGMLRDWLRRPKGAEYVATFAKAKIKLEP